jgi:hypothetical protein
MHLECVCNMHAILVPFVEEAAGRFRSRGRKHTRCVGRPLYHSILTSDPKILRRSVRRWVYQCRKKKGIVCMDTNSLVETVRDEHASEAV